MNQATYHIGGMYLSMRGSDTLERLHLVEGMAPFRVMDCEADEFVCFDEAFLLPSGAERLIQFNFEEGLGVCSFYRKEADYYFSIEGNRELALLHHRRDSHLVTCSSIVNASFLRYMMWMAYTLLALPTLASPIHSSVLVYRGEAVLFLGDSGVGKSTHTRLWREYIEQVHLLNDDSPIIMARSYHFEVYGSPWSGKSACFHQRCFPIRAIVRLSQGNENRMERISRKMQAFGALHPSLPPSLAQDDYYGDRIIAMTNKLIEKIPIYHLSCLPNAEAALLCCQMLYPDNE